MVDLTARQIQRALAPRLRGHGVIVVRRRAATLTITHCIDGDTRTRTVALPVAQLRTLGGRMQIFRRRSNGRWVPYASNREPFTGTLAECLAEISADRWGCFWS